MSEDSKVRLERKLVDVAIDGVEDDGTFEGYASLFDRVDMSRDIVERGAFSRAIARRGAGGMWCSTGFPSGIMATGFRNSSSR